MSWRDDTMISPPIEALLERVDSKFSLVTLAARRARQVNAYFNQLGEGLGSLVPPQVTSTARKPLSIAFEEIAADKIKGTWRDPDEVEAEAVAAAEAEPEA
jgi:DNA-directed RNA polymerase subunit omega